jgi:hypothetical protein
MTMRHARLEGARWANAPEQSRSAKDVVSGGGVAAGVSTPPRASTPDVVPAAITFGHR